MAHKQFTLENGLKVTIYKRKSNRSLRLTLTPNGEVRVTIPLWAPYGAGLSFAESRQAWIMAQSRPLLLAVNGQLIGKAHHLVLQPSLEAAKVRSRVGAGQVIVTYPQDMAASSPEVQTAARRAAVRALRSQAEQLLPQRLASLAAKHGFTYASVSVKQLKSRWGSCDHQQNIVLNLYLMQLPWEHIDYVLLHELTHTRILRHGPEFWRAMERILPQAAVYRKAVQAYQPVLDGAPQTPVA